MTTELETCVGCGHESADDRHDRHREIMFAAGEAGPFPAMSIPLAESAHLSLLDLIAACRGPRDEEILTLRLNGASQNDIAWMTGSSQATISRRLGRMMDDANFDRVGIRLRGRPEHAVPTEAPPSGLRFAKHRPQNGHRDCWCAKPVAA